MPRPRVHERLTNGRDHRLTVVWAPAGFGKTIALAGWLRDVRRPWVWVNLDELDSDLDNFVRVLVAAMGAVMPGVGRQALALAAQHDRPSLSQLSAILADDLATLGDDLVLVLDDFHLIEDPAIHALMTMLVRCLPPTLQLVIASRDEPPLQLASLRQQREMVEIRADDLRFRLAEGDAFLDAMSSAHVAPDIVAGAVERSEGWAVGLRLLSPGRSRRGSLQTSSPSAAARERRFVDDYLFEEVLSGQRPEMLHLLTRISILERFCAPLCAAVLDGVDPAGAQLLLDESMTAGLFLTSLDDERRWYRFHHLFREMLRRRLERTVGSDGIRALRRRASDWLASQGHWDEAANQAIDANDVDRLTVLIEAVLMTEQSISGRLLLESWTRRLQPDVVEASPTLSLARCRMLVIRGQVAELGAQLRRVEAILDAEPSRVSPALLPIARGQIDTQLSMALHHQGGADDEALVRLERALDRLPLDQHDLRGVASMLYAMTLQCLGRTDDALAWISSELSRGAALHPDYVARALTGKGYVELASGRLSDAARTAREMLAHSEPNRRSLLIGWGHLLLGRVAYEWNDLEVARKHFEAVVSLGGEAHRLCSINATLGLALTLVALRRPAEAERLVLAELAQAEEIGNTFVLESLRSFMARLGLAAGEPDRASFWLDGSMLTRQEVSAQDVEDPLLTRARILVARMPSVGRDEAAEAVDRAILAAEARHTTPTLVQGLALRALVERSSGDLNRAARSMKRALELGRPGQFTRVFIDLGLPLTGLLVELASHGLLPEGGHVVLDACRAESGVPVSSVPSEDRVATHALVTLTRAQLDVLRLIDAHLSVREIARLLDIDEEAVKLHATTLYIKLRTKA